MQFWIYFTFDNRVLVSRLLPYIMNFVQRGLTASSVLEERTPSVGRGFTVHFSMNAQTTILIT